nr:TIGR03960 family B12-binding radical SAM protein [Desulfurispora thermophila]
MSEKLSGVLPLVEKPARYIGGEWNAVSKDWQKTAVKVVFAFPDVYEVGMSHLGMQILYHVVNQRPDALMERVFAPWPDMERQMRQNRIPLFSLESKRPLQDFDIIAFTLQYEMSFTNIINMLDLAGLSPRADRRPARPLVIAGGPCAYNPEPLADFIDAFVIGEGEEVLGEIIDLWREMCPPGKQVDKKDLLRRLAVLPGVYVPALYRVEESPDGVRYVVPADGAVPARVVKRVLRDMDAAPYPLAPVVPYLAAVHDRMMLEVQRGCTRSCRFCQAGVIYRPVREKSPQLLAEQARALFKSTGYDEVSLTSLSTADYSRIQPLVEELLGFLGPCGVNVSLPSLRVDAFSVDLARQVQKVRRSTLTFAPEAGTQRLRDVINKGVTEQDLLSAVDAAFAAGWQAVKLYFMLGLPTETTADLDGIYDLARAVLEQGKKHRVPKSRLKVTVSVSCFVPKAHTPFQWEPQDSLDVLKQKQAYLREKCREKQIALNCHDPYLSMLEAMLARGDRWLGQLLYRAWQKGARFDGWSEWFKPEIWQAAMQELDIEPAQYAGRRYDYQHVLPWDHIDAGVSKKYLIAEHKRALAGKLTPDCRGGRCAGCGLCPALEIRPGILGGEQLVPLPADIF